jgi:hypothetical protein
MDDAVLGREQEFNHVRVIIHRQVKELDDVVDRHVNTLPTAIDVVLTVLFKPLLLLAKALDLAPEMGKDLVYWWHTEAEDI